MSVVELPLSNGGVTIVDEDVAENIKDKTVFRHDSFGYVKIRVGARYLYLHRFITNAPDGMDVDHINGVNFDNRRSNLRVVTHSQNLLNCRKETRTKSGYRLVYTNKKSWYIEYTRKYSRFYCGYYRSKHVAGIFADQVLVKIVGPFVRKNFPEKIPGSCLAEFLESTSGRIFRVVFSRRADGRQREMVCRTGVNSRHNNGTIPFDPSSMNLFSVYDVHKRAYRFIPLENVICIRFARTNYRVVA